MSKMLQSLIFFFLLTSGILVGEVQHEVSFRVGYEKESLHERVNQSAYLIRILDAGTKDEVALMDVFDDKPVTLSLPKGVYRYTLHTRLPHFRQSGRFAVDGDTEVNILHRKPRSFHRKFIFLDQNQEPIEGLRVRFSVHGDTNTHLVNHGRSFLHQGADETNEKGEIEIRLKGDPPERFRLHVSNHQYSRFYKILEPSFWDSEEPEIYTLERLAFNGEVEISVFHQAETYQLPAYVGAKYPGHKYGGALRLERQGVSPARLNPILRNDTARVPLYGLPDGEYTVRALDLNIHVPNAGYTMRPAGAESETFKVENGKVIPSPRGLLFSIPETTKHRIRLRFSDGTARVSGVETRITSEQDGTAYTQTSDENGEVSLELFPGRYTLRTVHPLYESIEKNLMNVEGGLEGRYTLRARPVLPGRYRFPENDREEVRAFSSPAPKTPRAVDVNP